MDALAERYPPVYKHWCGFAHRVAAEASRLGMNRLDEAAAEARRASALWMEVAALRQNYEPIQVAKSFRALMKCEIALNQKRLL